ncbi:MAG: alpha/beta hydrolase [Bacteroidota bacterium]
MAQKYALLVFFSFSFLTFSCYGQELRIKKGVVVDSLEVNDSINQTISLYLPRKFELSGKWPLLMVFNMQGQAKQEVSKYVTVADSLGYVVAASNAIHDSVTLTKNVLRTKRMLDRISSLLPIHKSRVYTAGIEAGGRFANLVPVFIKDIEGTISFNAALTNAELLTAKNPFHFIGVIQRNNHSYLPLLQSEKVLNNLRFQNNLLVYDGDTPVGQKELYKALSYFDLLAMARENIPKDTVRIETLYRRDLREIQELQEQKKFVLANRAMAETLFTFRTLKDTDSLRSAKRELKRSKAFRDINRAQGTAFFNEGLLREDFAYFLEEDVLTYNFNNLGWWNYQMGRINKYINDSSAVQQQLGHRLKGYINALIADNIQVVVSQKVVDEEALVLLYMLKTLTASEDFENYLQVVSLAAKNEDFGTALFYLEEALKKGFKDKDRLYAIKHTALLRITPEFNTLVAKYLDESRYKIKDE